MENIKIIIGQGNGTAGINSVKQAIEDGIPEKLDRVFLSHIEDVVVEKAQQTKNCIVLLGHVWGGGVFGHQLATRIKLVNKTAKVYHYSFNGIPQGCEDLFNGVVSKAPDELIPFIKGLNI